MNPFLPAAAITQETLNLAKTAFASPAQPTTLAQAQGLQKAGINVAQGLIGINLEAPSKKIFPVYSPLRNRIPRNPAAFGASAVQWKRITKINAANLWPGVAENTRQAAFMTTNTDNPTAAYVTLGFDDYVGFEALYKSKGFEDVRATAALNLLYANMIGEEKMILGGNTTALGAPGTPTLANAGTGGTIPAATYTAKVSALTLKGWDQGAQGNSGSDATGESTPSAASAGTVCAGSTSTITVTLAAAIKGAVAYNLYLSNGGSYFWQATFYYTNYVQTSFTGSGNQPNAADQTASTLDFQGIIPQIELNATAGLWVDQGGNKLTADNSAGIKEFDTLLQAMWDNYRLGPTVILVNSQQAKDITVKIAGSNQLNYRVFLQDGQKDVVGGIFVGGYLNKFASSFADGVPNVIPIKIHPNLPQGTVLFLVERLPYPNNQIPNVWEMDVLQEYTQYEWALVQRRYEFGIYFQEVLKGYFPAANGVIQNIQAG